ncbi:bifunctional acetate--CoA ligase family protein/GNAT family N-acetyltransferase [Tsukamurella strandjordii]|uniref:GNAT family N-acetyltransferase n=2 Tax=Tsukamurella strandjordii TaxID=147577 RepID=A0AA90S7Q6_9ACTN|nr:GNAT family N-acetyltransferase [Tsukamurella strandjordii]MDP0397685.1 GNAT family N-acetyltransferase [Tsukamurella strandjordii]
MDWTRRIPVTDQNPGAPADPAPSNSVPHKEVEVQAPSGGRTGPYEFPAHWVADVLASDGGVVHLRPVVPDDADAIVAFHAGLSERTRYLRYFGPYPVMPPRDVARMTTVDHHQRVCLLALLGDKIIAVGLYEGLADAGKPTSAEVAFVVADEHQGRGLGPILLEHLAGAAAECGFHRFEAEVLAENRYMVSVFKAAGYELRRSFDGSVVHVEFGIDPTEALIAVRNARELASEARSVRNALQPTSIAVIGASATPSKVGHAVLRNLIAGDFAGPVYPVHPERRSVAGIRAYESVRDIPDQVDLAVVAVPADNMDQVLDDCLAKEVRTLLVVSSGFSDAGGRGTESEQRLLTAVRSHGMRLIGPNALGVINTDGEVRLNATLAPVVPGPGNVGFFCQSGALGIAILDTATKRGVGLSTFVSAGNRADMSGNDVLQYWDTDPATEVVLLYLESFGNPRKFGRIARRLSRQKPIVAVHRGGVDYDQRRRASEALFENSGVVQVDSIPELFDCATFFSYQPLPAGPRVAVIGNSTALGVLATHTGMRLGLDVAEPVDLGAAATPEEFGAAIDAALADDAVDAIIAVFVPPVEAPPEAHAAVLLEASRRQIKPIVSTFLAFDGVTELLAVTDEDGVRVRGSVPSYPEPERAARVLANGWKYAQWRARPVSDVARPDGTDAESARTMVRELLPPANGDGGSVTLTFEQGAELLRLYGVEVVPFDVVASPEAAVAAADRLGYPVAVKAMGDRWRLRADLAAVRLDLSGPEAVAAAFAELAEQTGERTLHVQRMAAKGIGCALGYDNDPRIGQMLSFGLSGAVPELLGDRAYRLLPLTNASAHDLLSAPKSAPLLDGFAGEAGVDRVALIDVMTRIAALAYEVPEIQSIDCQPILATTTGASVLSVVIRIGHANDVLAQQAEPRRL